MRTTVTLDADVAAELAKRARRTGKPFKTLLNDALRAGLRGAGRPAPPYRLDPTPLGGVAAGIDLDRALRLADALEDEAIAAKLEMRK
jgi:hypothetical protein